MKYDDASWHNGSEDFPDNLPPEAGSIHFSFFIAWMILNDLTGELHLEESIDSVEKLKKREISCNEFVTKECDGKFYDEDLNEEGNAFAEFYYEEQSGRNYIGDYCEIFTDNESIYEVEDSWENYDRIQPTIDEVYKIYKKKKSE